MDSRDNRPPARPGPLHCPHNGEAAGIGRVLLDPEAALVQEEAVEDVRRLVRRSGDDLAVEGAELIGEMAVEADAGLAAISGVDRRRGETMAAGLEELPVR